ncbi:sulfite exporter TauE/SafE family protein [Tepidibacillus marianensis]|uniref:sulfite exporter TauE/SafE family protein n=1 Tax=Tepidibacillus marianensis TaxID=3131995 RepID=UPI0030CF0418
MLIQSVHRTRLLIFGSNIDALVIYFHTGFINWNYAIPLTLGSIVGAQIGFKVLPKIPQHIARIILMLITILLIFQIARRIF